METFERGFAETLRAKILEAELTLKEQHRREIEAVVVRYAQSHIEIREHEMIV